MTLSVTNSSQGAPQGAPLGSYAECSSRASQSHAEKRNASYQRRYTLQAASASLLPGERVCDCQRKVIPTQHRSVSVNYQPGEDGKGTASFSGLQQCGSVWVCPVCAAKVSEKRRVEISQAIARWRTIRPEGRMLLITFTLSHHAGEQLEDVLKALKRAREAVVSGRWAAGFKERYHISGMIRSLELTYGVNGWHPHMHVLYFLDEEPNLEGLTAELKLKWSQALETSKRYASYKHGVDVKAGEGYLADYVAKFGKEPKSGWSYSHELAKSNIKQGRGEGLNPWQLLAGYAELGDCDERNRLARLWWEYARAMKGQRQLAWSRGFRELLELGEEKTDEELAESEEAGSITMCYISETGWRYVIANDLRADLLAAAATGERAALQRIFDVMGFDTLWYRYPDGG